MGEEKWKANMEKVAFMKQFPGLAFNWEQVTGKTIESVTPLPSKPGYATLSRLRWTRSRRNSAKA
jgi:hypothetical protein